MIKDPKVIVEKLGNHYEQHFSEPTSDENNRVHQNYLNIYNKIAYLHSIPLDKITLNEVVREWEKISPKKSMDRVQTSASLLKKLPEVSISIVLVLFNKCSDKDEFFSSAKHAKIICLPKEGIYPSPNCLGPISLLPNIGKCFERIIHNQILKWCVDNSISTDEQSGFSPGRRLQTRVVSLIEELRLTIAANNRPALTIFVDFLSAFDRMWIPALIANLYVLGMPLPVLKWIFNWFHDRCFCIYYGNERSKSIPMKVGTPQGSVLDATLFRIHILLLSKYLFGTMFHLFADDLVLILAGSLENQFSENVKELEQRATSTLKKLENFADDLLLPANLTKTKAILVHDVVAPPYPRVYYKTQQIEYVQKFRYLGVTIFAKLCGDYYIEERLETIRKVYNALQLVFSTIRKREIKICRKFFFAYVLPHFLCLYVHGFSLHIISVIVLNILFVQVSGSSSMG